MHLEENTIKMSSIAMNTEYCVVKYCVSLADYKLIPFPFQPDHITQRIFQNMSLNPFYNEKLISL